MELSERQVEILSRIRTNGKVEVDGLSSEFSVTTQTIRRDLNEICERGLAARTHGGARQAATISNVGYEERRQNAGAAKQAIGARAAALVPDHCSVILNIGTTTEQVARALHNHADLVVISNNVNVINTLSGTRAKELILAGGTVRQSDGAIVGEATVEFMARFKVDFAVIGASALDEDGDVLDFDTREVSVARAILANARTKILVCDRLKFDRSASVRICHIGAIDYFVTDAAPPARFREECAANGVEVLIAAALEEAVD